MIFEKNAPLQEKDARYNQAKFMNKNLQKAIISPFRLLYSYRKEKTKRTRSTYKRQSILCETIKKDQNVVLQ